MRSIERRFKNIEKKDSVLSSYICFARAIKNQDFNKQTISYWFTRLVDKEDYDSKNKLSILRYLWKLSNVTEDSTNKGNI